MSHLNNKDFTEFEKFETRHIGPNDDEIGQMLNEIGADSIEQLIDETIPSNIRLKKELELPKAKSEAEFLRDLKKTANQNQIFKSYIGLGYNPTITPPVILRNVLENPGWYTQYTPYQAEIAQGRLEALLNFQTIVIDLTGLPIANASLLDEGTAAAEAMHMFYAHTKNKNAHKFFVSEDCFPQTIDIMMTRAEPVGIEIVTGDYRTIELNEDYFGVLVQYPTKDGEVQDYKEFFEKAHSHNIFCTTAVDIMSLALLVPPGEFGADAAVGSTQRFGVPMGFGGPHAAFFATKDEFKRHIPGRIIGVSVDANGNRAYRMALQTREQHIRREKATSNICTAQVLLGVIAGMYGVYHGPDGIKAIAERIHGMTASLDTTLTGLGYKQLNTDYFDTIKIELSEDEKKKIKSEAEKAEINFRYIDNGITISLNEPTTLDDLKDIVKVFTNVKSKGDTEIVITANKISQEFLRDSNYMFHPVFNTHHSETEMLRYLKHLENKDLSLAHSMIPLGSCTMKLNSTSEMIGVTWSHFGDIHPFAPSAQWTGYAKMISELEDQLKEITSFTGVSLQPNSGAQGEYAGLMVIRAYHKSSGEGHRNICIIPASAHGTNPASAVMAGMKVVVVKSNEKGNVDWEDFKLKVSANSENLAAMMITYPSTHGVFEGNIVEMCDLIHDNGGLVYMDGANMNAQVGLTSPGMIHADVCHLNLHKTFCIPHGGGGPGMGPICVNDKLKNFLPGHAIVKTGGNEAITSVSAAPWGSASILIISYAYICMMGAEGLRKATETAILNANYMKAKLEPYYKVLYKGSKGRVAHELIFDLREFKLSAGIEVEDVAKRLMDYGFHAPTVSFPVPGTLMVEPTESEAKAEIDRFCDAMIAIRKEISEIENGTSDKTDNVLKNAPHTIQTVIEDNWNHSYSRQKAAYPLEYLRHNKFWASVGRVNNAYGDRNLICSCVPISDYMEELESKAAAQT